MTKPRFPLLSTIIPLIISLVLMAGALGLFATGPQEERLEAAGGFLLFLACSIFYGLELYRFFRPKPTSSHTEAGVLVQYNDEEITAKYGNGDTKSIRWAEVTKVGITTTDEGPFVADVFWGLHGENGEVAVVFPQEASGFGDLLKAMQERLPEFDNRRVIEAMGSANNAHFIAWTKIVA